MEMTEKQKHDLADIGVAIDPESGEFDISLLPENEQKRIMKMANNMIMNQPGKKQQKKKKPRVKKPKTFGKNKKKKK
jgi:hypothetical protein